MTIDTPKCDSVADVIFDGGDNGLWMEPSETLGGCAGGSDQAIDEIQIHFDKTIKFISYVTDTWGSGDNSYMDITSSYGSSTNNPFATGSDSYDGTFNTQFILLASEDAKIHVDSASDAVGGGSGGLISLTVDLAKLSQSITFNSLSTKTYGDVDFTVSASASSGLSVSFSTSGNCSNSGSTISISGAGSCNVTASQSGNSNYNAATSVPQTFTINKINQTITGFSPSATGIYGGSASLSATGGASGNSVTFASSTTSVCTVSGSTVNYVGVGTCTVNANQANNANYNAATQVSSDIIINKANQSITGFSPTSTGIYGGNTSLSATGGASGNSVIFTSSTTGVCTVSGSTVNYVGVGTCTVNANQTNNANYNAAPQISANISISKANQSITGFSPTSIGIYGGNTSLSATGGASGNSVTFTSSTTGICTVSSNTVSFVNLGTCTVNANQASNVNYNAAPQVSANISVSNTTPTTNNSSISTNEDTAKTGTLSASDADSNPLTYSIITNGTKGAATITNTSAFTYTPSANTNGADSFTFKVNDGLVDSNVSTISVTINSINDAPTFTESAQHAITLNEDNSATAAISTSAYSFNLNATDIDVDTITWSIQTPATQGTASVSGT
ncbi:Ig-like domain-containing protein, partial [Candidatus Albibeggiatoa sp. nov. BB20]|uniref:Ig-like domain-containing protein n=1 Tax=Candidatus Albibeggiatoa sp. nov. BB20 TaxID=3162723 RepID=UPI0033654923